MAELATIVLPLPTAGPDADEAAGDGIADLADEVRRQSEDFEHNTRLAWDEGNCEPLLSAISEPLGTCWRPRSGCGCWWPMAGSSSNSEPRPYLLDDLAHAAGMSISGVRTAYTHPRCCGHRRNRHGRDQGPHHR
ncbi:hypothetical protein AB0I53_32650 [Saccharopolyspora sp. NPDC050389]|uniref:hypothetical protein n=1 Tax=Saccharopolyspora sp. NPDC050389 TaxID=3155516 RepID=UPI0034047432